MVKDLNNSTRKVKRRPALSFPIEIPIKKHLYYFMKVEFGENHVMGTRNPLGRIVFSYLSVKNAKEVPVFDENQYVLFPARVPYRFFERRKVSVISQANMFELGDWVDRYFNRLMVEYVQSRLDLKNNWSLMQLLKQRDSLSALQIDKSIQDFLDKYNINEEIMKTETAKKRLQRCLSKSNALLL